jgi:hypothetical protein
MTYDPDRDVRAPGDVNPNTRPYDRQPHAPKRGNGLGIMLGLLVALLIGGFVFYNISRPATVATDGMPDARPPVTTGAGLGSVRDSGTGMNPPAAQQPSPAPQPVPSPAPRQ